MSYQTLGSAAPFYDDWKESNNFLRIMFNPSRAVQARELTQLQTILQNQIQKIGSDLYKDNTPISGASISVSNSKPTVQVSQFALIYNSGTSTWAQDGITVLTINPSWIGKVFQNTDPANSSLTPSQTMTITGYLLTPGQNPILYYEFSGSNVSNGENMYDSGNQGTSIGGFITSSAPTSSMVASCTKGIIWTRGFFVDIEAQDVVLSNNPLSTSQYNVGFLLNESIINSQNPTLGVSLLDPANGSYNFNAPGADRYQITATLTFYDVSLVGTLAPAFLNNFVPFAFVINGAVAPHQADTQLGAIQDALAQRTFDANGNFVVNNFNLTLQEAATTLVPFAGQDSVDLTQYPGFVTGDTDINNYLVAQIGPGKAYVHGYEVQKFLTSNILVHKGRDIEGLQNDVLDIVSPFYVVANLAQQSNIGSAQPDGSGTVVSTVGSWLAFNQMERVQIMSGTGGNGRVLSEARIYSVDRQGDLIRIFLIETNVAPITAAVFVAGNNYTAGQFVYVTGGALNGQIFQALANVTSAINPSNDPTNWDYITDANYPVTAGVVDSIKFNSFGVARSIRSLANNGTYVNLALNSAAANATPLTGSGPAPLIYAIPNISVLNSHAATVVQNMLSTYNIVLNSSIQSVVTADASNITFASQNQEGVIYAYVTQSSVGGLTNSLIDVSQILTTVSGNTVTLDFSAVLINGNHLANGDKIAVVLKEQHSQAQPRTKTKSTGTFTVTINSPTTDIVVLDNEDCIAIQSIVQTTNNVAGGSRSLTQSELLALRWDDGQRDCYYDYGSISNFSSLWTSNKLAVKDIGTGDYIPTTYVITYTYYNHENNADKIFFSLPSYSDIVSADDYDNILPYRSPTYGDIDLLIAFDFRRKISELENGTLNLKWPAPFDAITIPSVNYYVGRYMLIGLDQNGNFTVTQGIPSTNPSIPGVPGNTMLMWTLGITPYTFDRKQVSIAMTNNNVYTMKDIFGLDQRIKNLESFVSLNALESAAASAQILDPTTGQQAFTSGIFTDSFLTTSNANSVDPLYRVSADSRGPNLATPKQFWNMQLGVVTGATATIGPNLATLPITGQLVLAKSLVASETVNLNPYTFYVWRANVTINPAVDTWYETQTLPEQTVTVGSWNPPPGYNPTPLVNQVQTNWVGYVNIPASQTSTPATQSVPASAQITIAHPAATLSNQFGSVWEVVNSTLAGPRLKRVTNSENSSVPASSLPNVSSLAAVNNPTTSASTTNTNIPLNVLQSYQVSPNATAGNVAVNVTSTSTTTTTSSLIQNSTNSSNTRIVDQSLIPYMRAQTIAFNASGMRPGMAVSGTLDGVAVQIVVDAQYLTKNNTYVTDGAGNISGVFLIPNNKFTTGVKQFTLVDSANTSSASAMYSALGYLTQTQTTITTVRSVEVVTDSTTTNSQVIDGVVQTPSVTSVPPISTPVPVTGGAGTPTTGTVPRGGANGCVVVDADVLGFGRADSVYVGAEIELADESTFEGSVGVVTHSRASMQPCVEIITSSEASLKCSTSAPIPTKNGLMLAPEIFGQQIAVRHGEEISWEYVVAVSDIGEALVQHISVDDKCFWASSNGKGYILHHNKMAHFVDPIAQSFQVTQSNGCFLSSMTLYFASKSGDFVNTTRQINGQSIATVLAGIYGSTYPKDVEGSNSIFQNTIEPTGIPMQLYLVAVENGAPTQKIVPLSRVTIYPNQINSHPLIPSQGASTITWPDPIYLQGGAEYAVIMVSSSKEYNLWTGTLGKEDIFQNGATAPGQGIASQPYLGQFFESKNSSTWVPQPLTVLTFSLNYAQFAPSATVAFRDTKIVDDNSYINGTTAVWNAATAYPANSVVYYNYLVSGVTQGNFFLNTTATTAGQVPVTVVGTSVTVNAPWEAQSNQAYGGSLLSKRYLSEVIPVIGEMIPNATSISYSHLFFQGLSTGVSTGSSTYTPCVINNDNDVTALGPVTGVEKQVDNGASSLAQNYRVQAQMSTNDPNVSPVIDLQQTRAIATRNLVLGVDPDLSYGGLSNSVLLSTVNTSGVAAAKLLGKVALSTAYQPNSVVYYPSAPTTFYQYVGTSPLTYTSGGGDLETQFFNDIKTGKWIQNTGYVPPFIDNTPTVGDAGTYISETVSLNQQADNLTLTLDWKKIGASYLNVYYRTTTDNVEYIYTSPYNDSEGLNLAFSQGQTMKIKYRGAVADASKLSNIVPGAGSINPQCSISGITTEAGDRGKVFLSAVSELDAFAEGLTYDALGNITGYQNFSVSNANYANINTIILVLNSETSLDSITELVDWDPATQYNLGDVVCTETVQVGVETANFRIWKAAAYIAPIWVSGTTYTTNQLVIISGGPGKPFLAYKALSSTTGNNPTTDGGVHWALQYSSAGVPAPAYGIGTVPSALGTGWNEIPSISVRSGVETTSSNDWKPMALTTNINTASLVDNTYYEMQYRPQVAPPTPFTSFAVRIDMRTAGNDRIDIPAVKGLRVVATY